MVLLGATAGTVALAVLHAGTVHMAMAVLQILYCLGVTPQVLCNLAATPDTISFALLYYYVTLALLKVLSPWPFSRNSPLGSSQSTVTMALLKVQ